MRATDWLFWAGFLLVVTTMINVFLRHDGMWSHALSGLGMALLGAAMLVDPDVSTLVKASWATVCYALVAWDLVAMIRMYLKGKGQGDARAEVHEGQDHGSSPEEAGDGA